MPGMDQDQMKNDPPVVVKPARVAHNVKPITPAEILAARHKEMPLAVIDAFNTLIAKNFRVSKSVVYQEDVVDLLESAHGINRQACFNNNWLDVEDIYREQGWIVEYFNPSYYEGAKRSYFTFEIPLV